MVLSPKIEVRTSAIAGRGLYAKEHIAKGETVGANQVVACHCCLDIGCAEPMGRIETPRP